MTLIAIDAVVHISANPLVVRIGRTLGMAVCALKYRVVVGIDVARGAHTVRVAMVNGERRVLRVIEGGIQPACRCVASSAGGWKELRLRRMPGIRRRLVVSFVAAVTIRRQCRVIVIDVAVRTEPRRHRVLAR